VRFAIGRMRRPVSRVAGLAGCQSRHPRLELTLPANLIPAGRYVSNIMAFEQLYDFLRGHLRLLGALAIVLSIVTWAIDLAGLVHTCPYCQVQRSAIGIAGVFMMLPDPRIWWIRIVTLAVCFMGAHVAAAQLFLVYRNLTSGRPSDPMNLILATAALFILVGQVFLVLSPKPPVRDDA